MVIANNLDSAERIFMPHSSKPKKKDMQYKWYDYVVFLGIMSIVFTGVFLAVIIATLLMFG